MESRTSSSGSSSETAGRCDRRPSSPVARASTETEPDTALAADVLHASIGDDGLGKRLVGHVPPRRALSLSCGAVMPGWCPSYRTRRRTSCPPMVPPGRPCGGQASSVLPWPTSGSRPRASARRPGSARWAGSSSRTVWSAVTMARLTSMMFFTGSSACAYWSWSRAVIAWGYFADVLLHQRRVPGRLPRGDVAGVDRPPGEHLRARSSTCELPSRLPAVGRGGLEEVEVAAAGRSAEPLVLREERRPELELRVVADEAERPRGVDRSSQSCRR